MLKKSLTAAFAGIALLGATPVLSQGIGHTWFMRGTIVEVGSTGTVVCIGKADGAEVGQVLDVYRIVPHTGPQKGTGPSFHRKEVGEVRIDHVFDDHFAHVTVVSGKPARNDIVELQRSH
ncbi:MULTISPECIES: hypothetical protein [Sphingomonadales]|jgi:hypothetical protein|uniref:Uncharacterized protein n=1 Tax=Novosphingobium subterraneum TaxID=48936 RepID=A0A0B9AFD3_9SPHN|nr:MULTISPECIES: hypothetical protein [Sphingomonadales]MAF59927.1 hypothetical protein [Blastomonas sp.]MBA3836075.1 hypothetical protein [Zymomonas sp.]OHC92765.1 MAG: hypothetical protein A2792_15890 [Sphingomonadales bacterium RIFCSPHIGHO2_01_FULL_65_20]KHS49388.1 hypothetical protein NJ75_00091 [Novosphingobium subterraneum]KHS49610.1 hypothetical protein NJ75_00313 [Novosphingobium subterraneum]|tara:strand:- start:1189 stop:1548 length:360 start_codon:yes stop_codon:yes gene_type:complete